MTQSTSEVQVEREALLARIRNWERELDSLIAENGQVVLFAHQEIDKKLVAHFENQFIIQKNRLDQLKHHVKLTGGDLKTQESLDEFSGFFSKLQSDFVAFSESLS
ncbi:MAG: hypothetical protein IPN95_02975 [Bacteroidetes bacterium]|nr:hypothetical protein [Bacteroidota bacterium]MBL0017996.1 hypothetical protein [Bacteroidota bacterium]